MTSVKLSQYEADRLLNMLKNSVVSYINFPTKGTSTEFKVIGDSQQDVFAVNIFRGKINHLKYNIGARIQKNGVMLLELHITPSNKHTNPDGNVITGSHWHIYNEEFGRLWAFPAGNINNADFVDNTILFLDRFHIIKKPSINFQFELY